jgi:uncharacterized protein YqgC (DUF456 family)
MIAVDIVLIIFGVFFLIVGIAGCILPVIPGPPLSYIGLLFLHFTSKYQFTNDFLIMWAVIAIAVTILDNLIPIWGTKKYGGSKKAVWGSAIGLVIGLFLFPPFGIIIGPFAGAVVGELVDGKHGFEAIKSGFGAFIGFLGGIILKLISSGFMVYHFFRMLIQHY